MPVRNALQTEIEDIVRVHVSSWQLAYRDIMPDHVLDDISVEKRRALWQENLRQPARRTLVYEDDSRILGFASYGQSRDEETDDRVGELMAIYVDPAWWRRGIGRSLWEAAQDALIRDFSEVTVWVLKDNTAARQFYEDVGFVVEPGSEKPLPWYDADLIEVRYRKMLSSR